MTSRIAGDPFAGKAQWVIEVAMRMMPLVKNIPLWFDAANRGARESHGGGSGPRRQGTRYGHVSGIVGRARAVTAPIACSR